MQGIGSIQNVGGGFYTNKATPRKEVRDKGGGDGRQGGQNTAAVTGKSARNTIADSIAVEPKNPLRKSTIDDKIIESGRKVDRGRKPATSSNSSHSAADYWKMDRSFGVEKLSYKKMWKVLKTVVREIGDIKEASSGQFFLGVSERLEKATTLMQFGSIVDYLGKESSFTQKAVSRTGHPKATYGEAGRIAADPNASLRAQANVAPEVALNLLAGEK